MYAVQGGGYDINKIKLDTTCTQADFHIKSPVSCHLLYSELQVVCYIELVIVNFRNFLKLFTEKEPDKTECYLNNVIRVKFSYLFVVQRVKSA